ncbi:MAG: hypothetical protein ACRDRU_13445 [Pseudonocardiaceae bacterium]
MVLPSAFRARVNSARRVIETLDFEIELFTNLVGSRLRGHGGYGGGSSSSRSRFPPAALNALPGSGRDGNRGTAKPRSTEDARALITSRPGRRSRCAEFDISAAQAVFNSSRVELGDRRADHQLRDRQDMPHVTHKLR